MFDFHSTRPIVHYVNNDVACSKVDGYADTQEARKSLLALSKELTATNQAVNPRISFPSTQYSQPLLSAISDANSASESHVSNEPAQTGRFTILEYQHVGEQDKNRPSTNLFAVQSNNIFGDTGVLMRLSELSEYGAITVQDSQDMRSRSPGMHQVSLSRVIPNYEPRSGALAKFYKGHKIIQLDNNIIFKYIPGRSGTRSTALQQTCFLCDWKNATPYVVDSKNPSILYTPNSKPYTVEPHILVSTLEHKTQEFNVDVFQTTMDHVHESHLRTKENDLLSMTGYYSGRVGNSQKHQHWHLVSLKSAIEFYLDNHDSFDHLVNEGLNKVRWITSDPLKDMETGENVLGSNGNTLHYFQCILVEGDRSFITAQVEKIVKHLSSPKQLESDTMQAKTQYRCLYNMTILPNRPDSTSYARLVIFPRNFIDDKADKAIARTIFNTEKAMDPGANEYAGMWVSSIEPKVYSTENKGENFHISKALHELVALGQVNREDLEFDKLYRSHH